VLADWPASIASIPSGGGLTHDYVYDSKDVLFIGLDGKLLYAYTKAEALALTELPEEPDIEGFTKDGWNYTLSEMKTEVNSVGECIVGAHYVPSDAKHHVYIVLENEHQVEFDNLKICEKTSGKTISVDWGDGSSTTETSAGSTKTFSHTYSPSSFPANYEIKISSSSTMYFVQIGKQGSNTTTSTFHLAGRVRRINFGEMLTPGTQAIQYRQLIEEVTFPRVMSPYSGSSYTFNAIMCYSVRWLSIPRGCTSVVANSIQPRALAYFSIPPTVTSVTIDLYNSGYTHPLLRRLHIPSTATPGSTMNCNGCTSLVKIRVPSGVTKVNFHQCMSLLEVDLPSTVTTLDTNAFSSCKSMLRVSLPGVTSVVASCFSSDAACLVFDFSGCSSVPSLANTNAFQYTSSDKKIVVPDSLYSTWITASNWNSSTNGISTAIIKKSDFDAL
jgi:hypothetical protein